VVNHLTLDGVMQAPGRPDEDTRGGFEHGGWAIPRNDELMQAKIGERMCMGDEQAFLFGRRSYEGMLAAWNAHGGPHKDALNNATKYVGSRNPLTTLAWPNSILLSGDAANTVTKLKAQQIGTLTIFGSGELIGSLIAADLIDEYLLMVHPLVLGTGRRMFTEGQRAPLRLIDCTTTTTGVLLATYQPAR
jgi:dihydrofolate reductase